MRLGTYVSWILLVLGLSSCMKKATTTRVPGPSVQNQNAASLFNPQNPRIYTGAECPNGLYIQVQTVTGDADLKANSPISFEVTAVGCKYGYDLAYQFGDSVAMTTDSYQSSPELRRNSTYRYRFTQTFSAAGTYPVRVNIYPKSSESSGSYTSFFEGSTSVTIADSPTYTCTVSPANFTVRANSVSSEQMFIVSSSAPADKSPQITEVIGVDGTVTSGYVRNAPTLPINLPSGSPLSTSAFKVTVGGDSGTIRFKVATNDGSFSTCTAQGIMESAVDVKGNFSGEFPGTREDHFYFVPNPSGSKDIKVDYVDRVGRYSTLILGITIPNADLPERMYAGDIDGDLKDDVILFKAGSFRWMQSKGNNGFEAPQAITGGWSAARIMTSVYFVPAANGVGARLQGFINGAPYRSFISRDGVTEPEPSPGEVFLALNSVVQSGGTYTANLTWSGANVRDCELLKCDLPEGATTCTPNLLVRSLALNENTIQGTGLTATQALAVRCFQLNNSGPLLTNPPVLVKVPNTCNVTNLVLSATKTNASLGLNNLTLPSLSFPADTQSVDIRLSSMIVDDNSPNITINGRQAYQLNEVETLTGLRTLPNLSYPITGFVNPGVNDLKCSVRNASGTSSSCSITLNGSYKTYGSCPADPRLSQVIGYFEGISAKKLTGYACETFSSRSITVKVYLGAPPGTSGSTLIGDFVANAASAGPVQQICSSTGTAHRFSIDLTSWIPLHKGKLIYLVGIHSNAALNAQLGNSGIVKVPNQ